MAGPHEHDPGYTVVWHRRPSPDEAPVCWHERDADGSIVTVTDMGSGRSRSSLYWARDVERAHHLTQLAWWLRRVRDIRAEE